MSIPKIALCQIDIVPGNPEANIARMVGIMRENRAKAEVFVFPEMAVGGYLLGDLWLDEDWCDYLQTFNRQIQAVTEELAVTAIFGNIYTCRDGRRNQDGRRRKYNAAYVYSNGKPAVAEGTASVFPDGIQPKTLLPNYRFFDDRRYFFSLVDAALDYGVPLPALTRPFTVPLGGSKAKIGVQLCEDIWCQDYREHNNAINVTRYLTDAGADFVVNISASPWTYGKNAARDRQVEFVLSECRNKRAIFYVNRCGAENNGKNIITYDGGSTVYGEDALPLRLANSDFNDEVMICELVPTKRAFVTDTGREMRMVYGPANLVHTPRANEPKQARKLTALIRGLQHLPVMTGKKVPPFLIGLSGGIDSCVAACVVAQAFGKEALTGVTMPGTYTSSATLSNAQRIAGKLGIKLLTVPIDDVVAAASTAIDRVGITTDDKQLLLAHENEIARTRGSVILSGLAARLGAIYTNNGNKLETALGYCTLYGDVNGAVALLGDMTKVEVVELARYLNEVVYQDEVIPWNLFPDHLWRFPAKGVAPSAELKADQIDPMKFGYHDALLEAFMNFRKATPEQVLRWYLQGVLHTSLNISLELMARWELLDPQNFIADLEWFTRQMRGNVFKRVQAPPVIITSKTAFGFDLRETILPWVQGAQYRALRGEVLALASYPSA